MPFLDPVRFEGSLSGHGSTVPVGFTAAIDDLGRLNLNLDRLPATPAVYALRVDQRPGSPVDYIALAGISADGRSFRSDSFHIARFNHSSEPGLEISYQGDCADAEIDQPANGDTSRDARVWLVRQLRTFRRLSHETPVGRLVIGGPSQDRDAQEPNGFMALTHPSGPGDEAWWAESERLLTHVARVISFACDTYILPVIEQRFVAGEAIIRVVARPRAAAPYMQPFHELHFGPIFARACVSFPDRHADIEALDPAIRWLTAPVAYEEGRLIGAMSAIENILERCDLNGIGDFLPSSAFKKLAKRIRSLLAELDAPEGIIGKVPELNRRSLAEKLTALLDARGIVTSDMPEGWLGAIIRARNIIVHTGIAGDAAEEGPDTLDHIIWAREIATRIILNRLGFEGVYRSWLHHDEQLRFPECVPMAEWVATQEAAAAGQPP